MSIGILGQKVGMTRVYDDAGIITPVTVILAEPNAVLQVKTVENDGYAAVQVAYGKRRASRVNKAQAGHLAKAGVEEGVDQIGQSCVIAPSGEIVVQCSTLGDELQVARCDLDLCNSYKASVFNFALHRRPEHYGLIVQRVGAGEVLGRS